MSQSLAIVPAAGRSRRMAEPKLLLPWKKGTVIDAVLRAWTSSRVQEVVVVVRKDDQALQQACRNWPVHVIHPAVDPPDMKHSIECALRYVDDRFHPSPADCCFFAPADIPQLTSDIIDQMLTVMTGRPVSEPVVLVPTFGDRSGHPVLIPWTMTHAVFELADDEGLNALVERSRKESVRFPVARYFSDLDTPEEYRAAAGDGPQGAER